ncbi:MAG: bifunctional diaminohydroxyphosphoribosylaminopyrimidine deaminase/5-amino-6-(5-phosphoribosylamino)uracil reductase RibD [Lentisphaerae bacterium]|nr:bifunctional diaminohydroxyphosphoribosylaminopyrimidine deaminase/5-amino-6-(5-phosphoribosylamino)uracil reductase RibD [Lentisphaerota bacterium]
MQSSQAADRKYMNCALALAREAWGMTSPNPMVGAVVVKDSVIVGRGFHHKAGTPHAEVHALNDAGDLARGATIYVTLEPCCTWGRTPPCTEAIKRAGIRRVVAACEDFNPAHAGKGFEILRSAGIEVKVGVCRRAAIELNKAFFSYITRKRPYVILKMAMTLDGKIATESGDSKWITGSAARRRVQELRRWCDAIMVGGQTVRLDRPGLIVRDPENWPCQPVKYIYTRSGKEALMQEYFPAGESIRCVAPQTPDDWESLLRDMAADNITALLLEGGGELAAAAIQNKIVDEVEFHIAPKLLTGRNSRSVVGGVGPDKLADAFELEKLDVKRAGNDLIVSGKTIYNGK